jgi:hypothetical protein
MTTVKHRPLAEINEKAMDVLFKELGPVDTARFLAQYGVAKGDYTKERETLYGDMTLDDIVSEIKRRRQDPISEKEPMNFDLHIHYSQGLEWKTEKLLELVKTDLPKELKIEEIREYEEKYLYVLPPEVGGDWEWRDIILLGLAFGGIQGFIIFAKAFLSKSGELLAEKLFTPMSKEERRKTLEKAQKDFSDETKEYKATYSVAIDIQENNYKRKIYMRFEENTDGYEPERLYYSVNDVNKFYQVMRNEVAKILKDIEK